MVNTPRTHLLRMVYGKICNYILIILETKVTQYSYWEKMWKLQANDFKANFNLEPITSYFNIANIVNYNFFDFILR